MKIKTSARVRYAKNPLVEVLCQVRFNRLLSLEKEPPAELQERFAQVGYPTLIVDRQPSIQIAWSNIGAEEATYPNASSIPSPAVYHFNSADGLKKISLNSEFIAFSCQKYEEWKLFQAEFLVLLKMFLEIYRHVSPVRLGLRYKDLISREDLGLAEVPWSELITPLVGGIFHAKTYFEDDALDERSVVHQAAQVGLSLDDCELLLQTALLKAADGSGLQAFLIDSDFFQELPKYVLSFANIEESLHALHNSAGAIFHHCIEEKLHHALGPIEL
nr:TIGR04255 family protein [uncultured Duganella sp.]